MISIDEFDCVVVGAGFCGSVIARKIAEYGKKVLIFERRNHIAGNMYDEIDANGILVHKHGPHIFHTNSKVVFDFISKYDTWIDYHHCCAVEMDGKVSPSPANFKTVDLFYPAKEAENLKKRLEKYYNGKKTVTILELLDSDDPSIKEYAKKLFELNYKPYTVKQWGIPPEEIDTSVLKRVPVRLDYTDGYFDDEYQCMPKISYTNFFNNLLDHKNIKVYLQKDSLNYLKIDTQKRQIFFDGKQIHFPVVYTGTIDELLDFRYGELPYRSLRFEYQTKNVESYQEAAVVAHPAAKGYTRITEYKKLPPQNIPGLTTIVYEYPLSVNRTLNNELYYPILTESNVSLFNKYKADLNDINNIFLCGRLADYKYYNMDAAILRAFEVFKRIQIKI